MLILPVSPKVLMPVPQTQWRDPSRAQFKDQFGNPGVQTRFRLTARLHDGHPKWRMWFDCRDDADQFLWSLAHHISDGTAIPREDWHLPNEIWGDPHLYPELQYDFATVTFLTTTGSNLTFNEPVDWVSSGSSIEGLAGGGSGGVNVGSFNSAGTGGGGAAYSKIVNFAFVGGVATYRVGSAGFASTTSSGGALGDSGGVTYFNASSDPGSGSDNTKLGAAFGTGGNQSSSAAGGVNGGSAASGWGTTKYSGGAAGASGTGGCSGGGGAAGISGSGGGAPTGGKTGTIGGTADNGAVAGGAIDSPGVAGTEWDATHGSGSGAGSRNGIGNGFSGGLYGGGGSGARNTSSTSTTSGAGAQGIIVVTYSVAAASSGNFFLMFS